jgi:hypothetical protein
MNSPENCPYYLTTSNGETVSWREWLDAWSPSANKGIPSKINLIRYYRELCLTSKPGLKEAKQWIDDQLERTNSTIKSAEITWRLLCAERGVSGRDLTKEEVLQIVDEALDTKEAMMFESYYCLLKSMVDNIGKKGGTIGLAAEIDRVIDAL